MPGIGRWPDMEEMLMMQPLDATRCAMAAVLRWMAEFRLVSIVLQAVSGFISEETGDKTYCDSCNAPGMEAR